jgi:nucleotide-binding universal stress UspA family protein
MKILLAVDESAPSRAAEDCVLGRPWPAQSVVRVLCVTPVVPPAASRVPPMAGAPMSFTPLAVVNDMQTQKVVQDSKAEVARLACEALRRRGLEAETRTRFGEAGPEIVAEAEDWSADLIVVGSHDRSKLKRLLLGSTASHVVQHARCSVEVARSPEDR